MTVAVIVPPAAVVSAAEAKAAGVFSADENDVMVTTLLAAAQGTIDGPDGWLGRAIGLQMLEWTVDGKWPDCTKLAWCLPCRPIRAIVSVKYLDDAGAEQTISPSRYALAGDVLLFNATLPSSKTRIRYRAGYGNEGDIDLPLPAPIKHAIILMAAQLRAVADIGGQVVREDVADVGSTVYSVGKAADEAITKTAEALLSTYRVFA